MKNISISLVIVLFCLGCNRKQHIRELLSSKDKEEIILGAYRAGETGDVSFGTLLIKNANDPRISTNINFKGFSVYQSKMIALKKIFSKDPPVPITYRPDSLVIKFYNGLIRRGN